MLCFLLSIFIVIGANRASANPQPLPFDFSPGIGVLKWESIDDDGGDDDVMGSTPFTGLCQRGGNGMHISDAISADGSSDAYDTAWLTSLDTTFIGTGTPELGDLTGIRLQAYL